MQGRLLSSEKEYDLFVGRCISDSNLSGTHLVLLFLNLVGSVHLSSMSYDCGL